METELKTMSRLVASKKRMTVDEISQALGLTRRQVFYRLEKINQVLRPYKVPPIIPGSVLDVAPLTRKALLTAAEVEHGCMNTNSHPLSASWFCISCCLKAGII